MSDTEKATASGQVWVLYISTFRKFSNISVCTDYPGELCISRNMIVTDDDEMRRWFEYFISFQ